MYQRPRQVKSSFEREWNGELLQQLVLKCVKDSYGLLNLHDCDHPITTWGGVYEGVPHQQERLFYRDVSLTWMALGKGTITVIVKNLVDKNEYLPLLIEVLFNNEKTVFEMKYN